jgi:chromosome transmission fidelity protein 1
MSIPFPWKPYPQQEDLMNAILTCIESEKIGLLESPTGTGKSLSTICASLHWLEQEENRRLQELESESNENKASNAASASATSSSDDWLAEMLKPKESDQKAKKQVSKVALDKFHRMKKSLKNIPDDELRIPIKSTNPNDHRYRKPSATRTSEQSSHNDSSIDKEELEYVLEAYDSDTNRHADSDSSSEDESDSDEDDLHLPQILYCSRTHSQISQYINEVQRVNHLYQNIRCISLGSRKNLCIHEDLKKQHTSDSRLSEACIDLQKNSKKAASAAIETKVKKRSSGELVASTSCPYHDRQHEAEYSAHALGRVRDIEELVTLGKKLHACPYYATRKSIRHAQIVCMPYTILLHEDQRKSMGIKLAGRVVIFDEAHNLIDTINQIYSAEISYESISSSLTAIEAYYQRFQSVLHGKNLYYINLLRTAIQRLQSYFQREFPSSADSTAAVTKVLTANSFIFDSAIDNINLIKLSQYIAHMNLIHRIGGYADHQRHKQQKLSTHENSASNSSSSSSAVTAIRAVISFLRCLMSTDKDGRILIQRQGIKTTIRYILFNPAHHFESIVNQARSIIMIGGTMKPFSYIVSSLFPRTEPSRITQFSCDHIVPKQQVATYLVQQGPSGKSFEFNYQNRERAEMMDEFYLFLREVVVPSIAHGVVIFFSSYSYMHKMIEHLRKSSAYDSVHQLKPIFVEVMSSSADEGDRLLARYSTYATGSRGAILFCVMGGKLSEGINFSDDLARCVVVLGLPYPDLHDPILQERISFISQRDHESAGKQYYENICMRQVNQSIGRSIRHRGDYASIILLDRRYQQQQIIQQLPAWIASSIRSTPSSSHELRDQLASFIGFNRAQSQASRSSAEEPG